MSDFLHRLGERALGIPAGIRPSARAVPAPLPAANDGWGLEVEDLVESSALEPRRSRSVPRRARVRQQREGTASPAPVAEPPVEHATAPAAPDAAVPAPRMPEPDALPDRRPPAAGLDAETPARAARPAAAPPEREVPSARRPAEPATRVAAERTADDREPPLDAEPVPRRESRPAARVPAARAESVRTQPPQSARPHPRRRDEPAAVSEPADPVRVTIGRIEVRAEPPPQPPPPADEGWKPALLTLDDYLARHAPAG